MWSQHSVLLSQEPATLVSTDLVLFDILRELIKKLTNSFYITTNRALENPSESKNQKF